MGSWPSILLHLAMLGATTGALAAASGAPPPLEAFGTVPEQSGARLAPGGALVAWQQRTGADTRVIVFALGSNQVKRSFAIERKLKLRSLRWADDDTLLATVSDTMPAADRKAGSYEYSRTLALDPAAGSIKMLLMGDGMRSLVTGATLIAVHTAKPKTVIMSTLDYDANAHHQETGSRLTNEREDSGWLSTLFEVDTRSGKGVVLERGSPYTEQWLVDAAGHAVARGDFDRVRHSYTLRVRSAAGWQDLYRRSDGKDLDLCCLSRDGSAIVAIGEADGRNKLLALPLDGSTPKVLVEDPARDVTGVLRDPASDALVGAIVGGLEHSTRWLDADAEREGSVLARAFAGRVAELRDRSSDGQKLLVRVEGTSAPPIYYLVDYATHRADLVAEEYPGLAGAALGTKRAVTYRARDGAPIPSYLTLPPAVAAQKLPLVVLPHGGPYANDRPYFDWWSQFLASRGYAVLQPQFRGSTGFGAAHREAGYRQWGAAMQDDITDAVAAVVAEGLADPHRVCIVGASYGGYAALAGAAFTPDLYACAASVAGVADLPTMLGYRRKRAGADVEDVVSWWSAYVGDAYAEGEAIAHSPARAAERIKVPVLLIHGTDDTVVPISQSVAMDAALTRAGRPHQFVILAGEDHWLSRSETRIAVLRELEAFLAKNL